MQQWNKYGPTAARAHGKPGRETRPKSITIDIHAHVGVGAAAEIVKPHLDLRTVPLASVADRASCTRLERAWDSLRRVEYFKVRGSG